MKLFLLTEEEILRIRSFVEEASNISIVECIYLVSYFSDKRMREQIDIIAITNDSMHYNYMLTGKATYDGTLSEENDLKLIIDKYNEPTCGRLYFCNKMSMYYPLVAKSYKEMCNERWLVNGTILFDRFGEKTFLKNYAAEHLGKGDYDNVLQIKNINQLFGNTYDNLVLKKQDKYQ